MKFLCAMAPLFVAMLATAAEMPLFPQCRYSNQPAETLAALRPGGGLQMLRLTGGEATSDLASITLRPGGELLLALPAPAHMKLPRLLWQSTGALKISVARAGTAETIELFQTLLWDSAPSAGEPAQSRNLPLWEYLGRWTSPRGWKLEHFSANNLLFVRFEPALAEPVTLTQLVFSAKPLAKLPPAPAVLTVAVTPRNEGGRILLEWTPPPVAANWLGEQQRPASGVCELAGEPFAVAPILLSQDLRAVAIPVGAKAGLLHFAHCAGPGNKVAASHLVGGYLLEYEDGTQEPIFCELDWNIGFLSEDWHERGQADYTWWGPPSFSMARTHRLPRGGTTDRLAVTWNAVYVADYLNPHPEKTIARIVACLAPGAASLGLFGISLTPPETAGLGLVTPAEGSFRPGDPLRVETFVWRSQPLAGELRGQLLAVKDGDRKVLAESSLQLAGPFAYATWTLRPADARLEPGPLSFALRVGTQTWAESRRLGLLPAPAAGDRPCYYGMIAGGGESSADFEFIRKLGYDSTKIHLPWGRTQPEENTFDWSFYDRAVARIAAQGLKVELRNQLDFAPKWLEPRLHFRTEVGSGKPTRYAQGRACPGETAWSDAITNYYRGVGAFAAAHPEIISINANYGCRQSVGFEKGRVFAGPDFAAFKEELGQTWTLAQLRAKTGLELKSLDDLQPADLVTTKATFIFNEYARWNNRLVGDNQERICKAIREAGFTGHLTYNLPMHYQYQAISGLPSERLLRLSVAYPPGSIFHETSDRFCLSFCKWLLAKRTFGLPYGDEGNQPPPTYEHNVLAYLWMAQMQCEHALYCQWFAGKPATQNVAWLKPYHQMLFHAEYLPDPVCLALSFASAEAEAADQMRSPDGHRLAFQHFGLANALLAANIAPDKYLVDRFPETWNVAPKVIIDDIGRHLDPAFLAKLEELIAAGAVFVCSSETGQRDGHAFLKAHGLNLGRYGNRAIVIDGKPVKLGGAPVTGPADMQTLASWDDGSTAIGMVKSGQGAIVLIGRAWDQSSYEIAYPSEYVDLLRRILATAGGFDPQVTSSVVNVSATPFRARDGSLLVYLVSPRVDAPEVTLRVRQDLVPAPALALDLNRALDRQSGGLPLVADGKYWRLTLTVPPLGGTVVAFVKP